MGASAASNATQSKAKMLRRNCLDVELRLLYRRASINFSPCVCSMDRCRWAARESKFSDPSILIPTVTFSAIQRITLQLTVTNVADPAITAADTMNINPSEEP